MMPTASRKQKCTVFAIAACLTKIFITVLVLLFFAWITTPKARLSRNDVTVKNLKFGPASPSFGLELVANVDIKNRNFGRFEILNGTVTVACLGMSVGRVSMGKDKVKAMSSKQMKVTISVNYKAGSDSQADSWLNHELGTGVIPLTFHAKFKGRVRELLIFFKEGKTAELKCAVEIDIETKAVRHLNCHVRQISVLG